MGMTMGMTGHSEYLNAEKLHLNAGGNDTVIAFVQGAQHNHQHLQRVRAVPGVTWGIRYGGDRRSFDYVAQPVAGQAGGSFSVVFTLLI